MNDLEHRLRLFWTQFLDRLEPACVSALTAAYDDLARAEDANHPLGPGDQAPDFALPDCEARPVRLSETLARGPALLLFFRGGWSPFCRLALRAYAEATPRFAAAGVSILALSAQRCDRLARLAFDDALPFPVLCDAGAKVAATFGIARDTPPALLPLYRRFGHPPAEENESGCNRLALAATYLAAPGGRILFAHRGVRPWERASPEEALAALHADAEVLS